MDTFKRCFFLSLAFLMFFFDDSRADFFGFQGEELIETMGDEVLVTSRQGVYNVEELEDDDDWQMVQTKGNQFVVNGQPFYVNGFNTYWLMVFAADLSTRGKVSELFQKASSVGLTVCRTWAFNDGQWRALQKSPSVYDEDVFKALDFAVSEAKKYKIRLILSLVNNWDAYGGKAQYVKWGNASGLNLTSVDEFFSHPTLRSYYKSHVKAVLNRVNTFTNITYKDDPTIFAWELMNEPRCASDPSGDTLQSWIAEMAAYVKSLDAKHLVEIGVEGFYGPSAPARTKFNPNSYATQVGTDFIRNHQALGVDFASVHIYADSWISQMISDAHLLFTKSWMEAHIEDAEKYLGMPVIFSEFGVSSKDTGYNSSYRDTLISTVYKTLLNSTKKGGSGAGSSCGSSSPMGRTTWMMAMQLSFQSLIRPQT
ncbi:Mannan endo-1,4-beta-mannosidase 6 [Hibiscus syriacus]|uniref:mannan endo-1,4-beta-mannosidase n=1 Tax=Hibiscus syriacus TaxID=106335 RepID=A0A6A2ZXY5_HIBSY|nr:Mannan endo-1,4-beta-mannosidase 6 [Hibiscus syriacus]